MLHAELPQAQPRRPDHLFGDGVRPGVPAGARADARRAHSAVARLRDVQRGDGHRRDAGQRRRHCSVRSASRSGSTVHRGSATSTCRSRTSTPTPTRAIGVVPGSCGHANYTREQLTEIVEHLLSAGLADGLPRAGRRRRRHDPRHLRRGAEASIRATTTGYGSSTSARSRDEQLRRAHDLGVTCSIFVDQIHYWGDIIVDGLFGPEHGITLDAMRFGRGRPGCASRCTTIHRSPPRSRCATSVSPPPGRRRAVE